MSTEVEMGIIRMADFLKSEKEDPAFLLFLGGSATRLIGRLEELGALEGRKLVNVPRKMTFGEYARAVPKEGDVVLVEDVVVSGIKREIMQGIFAGRGQSMKTRCLAVTDLDKLSYGDWVAIPDNGWLASKIYFDWLDKQEIESFKR